jgi:hypothetical protein
MGFMGRHSLVWICTLGVCAGVWAELNFHDHPAKALMHVEMDVTRRAAAVASLIQGEFSRGGDVEALAAALIQYAPVAQVDVVTTTVAATIAVIDPDAAANRLARLIAESTGTVSYRLAAAVAVLEPVIHLDAVAVGSALLRMEIDPDKMKRIVEATSQPDRFLDVPKALSIFDPSVSVLWVGISELPVGTGVAGQINIGNGSSGDRLGEGLFFAPAASRVPVGYGGQTDVSAGGG